MSDSGINIQYGPVVLCKRFQRLNADTNVGSCPRSKYMSDRNGNGSVAAADCRTPKSIKTLLRMPYRDASKSNRWKMALNTATGLVVVVVVVIHACIVGRWMKHGPTKTRAS